MLGKGQSSLPKPTRIIPAASIKFATPQALERYSRVREPSEFYNFFKEENNFVSHQLFNFRAMKKHGVRNVSANKLNNVPSNLMQMNFKVK